MIADELDRLVRQKLHDSLDSQKAIMGPHQFEGLVEYESGELAKFIMELYEANAE